MGFGLSFDLTLVCLVVSHVVLFLVILGGSVVLLGHCVVLVFISHDVVAHDLNIANVVLVLILMMLHFLLVRHDERVV